MYLLYSRFSRHKLTGGVVGNNARVKEVVCASNYRRGRNFVNSERSFSQPVHYSQGVFTLRNCRLPLYYVHYLCSYGGPRTILS
jgi:hypothetical protein